MDRAARREADLGVRGGKTAGRSHLVVLPVLAPEISRHQVRHQAGTARAAANRGVSRGGRRIDRRGVALECPDQARLDGEPRAQDGDARDGPVDRADGARAAGQELVDRRADRERRRGGPPGVVRQRLYPGQRHVSAAGGRVRGRDRGVRGSDGGGTVPAGHRPDPRSEEHTSELQSQSNLVCRLLLEKKKTTTSKIGRYYRRPPVTSTAQMGSEVSCFTSRKPRSSYMTTSTHIMPGDSSACLSDLSAY